jgi:hypothetical protein
VLALCGPDAVKRVAQRMSERAAKLGLAGKSEVVDVGVPGARVQQGTARAGAA